MTASRKWASQWQGILSLKLKPHWRWWDGGRQGEGRIVLQDRNLQGAQVRGLEGAHFERCDFSGSMITLLDEIELADCIFDEANLNGSTWRRARIKGGRFHGAWIGLGHFDEAVVEGGDWLGSYLERTFWTNATVTGVSFRSCTLSDSCFDGATFIDCDFHQANLGRKDLRLEFARCPNTRFVRCNFQGANFDGLRFNNTIFERCCFHDISGKPNLEGPCSLVEPDFSPRCDGYNRITGTSAILDPAEVLRAWRDWDAVRISEWSRSPTVKWEPERHYPERLARSREDE